MSPKVDNRYFMSSGTGPSRMPVSLMMRGMSTVLSRASWIWLMIFRSVWFAVWNMVMAALWNLVFSVNWCIGVDFLVIWYDGVWYCWLYVRSITNSCIVSGVGNNSKLAL